MATPIIMPKLGMAMTEGTIVKWLKQDGDPVEQGQPVVVVMSKKITYEVEAPATGILRIVAQPKETRAVGEALGFIVAPGEAVPEIPPAVGVVAGAEPPAPSPAAPPPPRAAPREVHASPAARRLAQELGLDITRVPGTGPGGRVTEKDVRRYQEEGTRIQATPLARRMAEEEGVDLAQIAGTGPGGRISEADVLRVLEGRALAARPQTRPFVGMRQAIAEQMLHSLHSMAQLTMTTTVDVTELQATREALAVQWGSKPSYTDLLVKAVAVALREHPVLGARLDGDEIVLPAEIHIGVAVALDEGLIVPVVRHADRLTVLEISDQIKDLAQRARANALRVDEVTGAVFTITNLGMYGVDAFTPIINPPEVAILGVGRIVEEPAVVNGQVTVRARLTLSLTIDHRVVDGAPGAAFLQTLTRLLEHPALIFAGRSNHD